jgi:hypothetical protein
MAVTFNVDSQIQVFATFGAFPVPGTVKTIYIDESTADAYYWDGSSYVQIRTESKYEAIDVLNNTGASVPKMSVCYLKTSSSSANTPEILLANATSEATSSKTIGILMATTANGSTDKLITAGEYDKFNTSAYNVGDRLWLGTTNGSITTTPPTQPNHAVFLGIVTRKQSQNGRILVAIQNGYELNELHNVLIDSPANGQSLIFDDSDDLWKNVSPTIEIDPVTIVAGDWVADSGIFKYTYTDSHITALKVVEIIPANNAFSIVQGIEVLPLTESFDGYVEFYCNNLPTEDFNVTILVRI